MCEMVETNSNKVRKRISVYEVLKRGEDNLKPTSRDYIQKCKQDIEVKQKILDSTKQMAKHLRKDKKKNVTVAANINELDQRQKEFLMKAPDLFTYLHLVEDSITDLKLQEIIHKKQEMNIVKANKACMIVKQSILRELNR